MNRYLGIRIILFLSLITAVLVISLGQAGAQAAGELPLPEPYRVMEKDLQLFTGPRNLTAYDQGIYFAARSDEENGLWQSDGSAVGTRLIRSFGPNVNYGFDSPLVHRPWVISGSKLYFLTQYPKELWRSDGTAAGTMKLPAPVQCADPYLLAAAGDKAYFFAEARGSWLCQAADPGVKIKQLGTDKKVDRAQDAVAGDRLLFFRKNSASLYKLGVTDGTQTGTRIYPSPAAGQGVAIGDTLFFIGCTGWGIDCGLWRLDGQAAEPELVKKTQARHEHIRLGLSVMKNHIYFSIGSDGRGRRLWKSDGTEAGTVSIASVQMCAGSRYDPMQTAVLGDRLFFPGDDDKSGCELWSTDGTAAGTALVEDVRAGDQGSNPKELTAAGDFVFFTAFDGIHGNELWLSDGTQKGTQLVEDIKKPGQPDGDFCFDGSCPNSLTVSNGRLYFQATDGKYKGLWALCAGQTPPVADFSAAPIDGPGPLEVKFENYSACAFSKCSWDFGDGHTARGCSTKAHTYDRPGVYTVTLQVSGPGGADSLTLTDLITVFEAASADFSNSPGSGPAPLEVNFSNLSSGNFDVCAWTFGDGATSAGCGPQTHTYEKAGQYAVTLTVKGDNRGDFKTVVDAVTVYDRAAAEFSAAPLRGMPPLRVDFKNLSSGDFDKCTWQFGDGASRSTLNDPVHKYEKEGTYTVSMTVSGPGGEDTMTKEHYIIVGMYRTYLPGVMVK